MADQIFGSVLTPYGKSISVNAYNGGPSGQIAQMAVGDSEGHTWIDGNGNRQGDLPQTGQADLWNEKYRVNINRIYVDPDNPFWLIAECIVPENVGGFWIREASVIDASGNVIAVSNWPASYKPLISEGGSTAQIIRVTIEVLDVSNWELVVDTSLALVTRDEWLKYLEQEPISARSFGDGITTDFQFRGLTKSHARTILVTFNGVVQSWGRDYTIDMSDTVPKVVFSEPPPAGIAIDMRTLYPAPKVPHWYLDNTEGDDYKIGTAEELAEFASIVNGTFEDLPADSFEGKTVMLTGDINLLGYSNGEGWVPIGVASNTGLAVFSGIFDGRGHVISNLLINTTTSIIGLFGFISSAQIKNLGIENADITGDSTCGILAGLAYNSQISDCYTIGNVSGNFTLGSIIGASGSSTGVLESYTTITNCYSVGKITGNFSNNAVGIAVDSTQGLNISSCVSLHSIIDGGYRISRLMVSINNCYAYTETLNSHGNNNWSNKGPNSPDGADISAAAIKADGTLGGLFTNANGWTTENGRLPGFNGKTVPMPDYIV